MNKKFINILLLFITATSFSQSLNIDSETSIFISEDAILTVENAFIDGALENKGDLFVNQSIDFINNSQGGNITFIGATPSIVSGKNLYFNSFTANSEANIIFTADSLFTNQLYLQSGVIVTGFTYLESKENIEGGSDISHIEGALSVKKQSTGSQYFPIGKNGHYNPISLNSIPQGSLTSVKINIPDESNLIPGDSLIGLNKQYEWEISYVGIPTPTIPTIEFQGIDLTDLPNKIEINAPTYIPMVAQFDSIKNVYKSLGSESIENTDNTTFGTIQAASSIQLGMSTILLSIGLAPTTDKLNFYVPNFFSPNSKFAENRLFRPFLAGTKISTIDIKIWDQYNRLVFSEKYIDPNMNQIGWNGENEPEGTYFYTIELESADGDYQKKGTVFLGR